jgi:hypothetical protein
LAEHFRRIDPRYERQLDVEVSFEGKQQVARTQNISLGGLYLTAAAALPIGATVQLKFTLPTQPEPVEVAGDVTLGFHESCHRADYVAYLKTNTLPDPPALAIGMTEGAYKAAVAAFRKALADYTKDMEQQSKSNTDEVGFKLSKHLATKKCFVHVVP